MDIHATKRAKIAEKIFKTVVESTANLVTERKYDKTRIKEHKNQILRANAKQLGLNFTIGVENEIRTQLCHKLIREVRDKKLRHIDLARVSGVPRPKITIILNGNLKEVTIDLLIRILGTIGVTPVLMFR